MWNKQLENEINLIIKNQIQIEVTKGLISGYSIEIRNKITGDDLGSFLYYQKSNRRDSDFEKIKEIYIIL